MNKCPICKKRPRNHLRFSTPLPQQKPALGKLLNKLCEPCQKTAQCRLGKNPTKSDIKQLYAIINGLLTSVEVRAIRKKLNLTQKEAALICGGGPNAFSRYERGETVPLRATSNLLRLLNKYPQESTYLLDFVK